MTQRKIARNSPLLLEINRYFGNRIILSRLLCGNIIDRPDAGPQIPPYKAPENEPMNLKRARLLYQSRYVSDNSYEEFEYIYRETSVLGCTY